MPSEIDEFVSKWTPWANIFNENAKQVSSIIRQLTLGGIAFAWFFRQPSTDGSWIISPGIASAMLFFAVAVVFDICQSLSTATTLNRVLRTVTTNPHVEDASMLPELERMRVIAEKLFYAKVGFALFGLAMTVLSVGSQFRIQ